MPEPPAFERRLHRGLSPTEAAVLRSMAANDNEPLKVLRVTTLPPQVTVAISEAISTCADVQLFMWLSANENLSWAERRSYLDTKVRHIRTLLAEAITAELHPVREAPGE